MSECKTDHQGKFRNWAQTIQFHPEVLCQPETSAKLNETISAAITRKKGVRVQGNGHSWSQFTLTDDYLTWLNKTDLRQRPVVSDVAIDPRNLVRATVPAGISLHDLTRVLAEQKQPLGLRNLGSIMRQSIAGAISTGTHGTGIGLGNLATQIVGMALVTVTAGGTIKELLIEETDSLLKAARVSVGALGIITRVTIDCMPDYDVELIGYLIDFKELTQALIDDLNANPKNQRVRYWWFVTRDNLRHKVIVTIMNNLEKKSNLFMANS